VDVTHAKGPGAVLFDKRWGRVLSGFGPNIIRISIKFEELADRLEIPYENEIALACREQMLSLKVSRKACIHAGDSASIYTPVEVVPSRTFNAGGAGGIYCATPDFISTIMGH
jgi:hypothetical protein